MDSQPPIKSLKPYKKVPWGARYTYGVTIFAYIVSQLFTLIPIIIAKLFYSTDEINDTLLTQTWMSLALTGVGAIGMLITLYWFMKNKRYSFVLLKITQKLPKKAWFMIVGTYIGYLILTIVVTAVVAYVVPGFNVDEVQAIGYEDAIGWQLLLAFIGLVVIPPIAEELLFRGFLYQGLRDHWHGVDALKWGLGVAVVVAALVNPTAGVLIAVAVYVSFLVGKKHPARAAAIITSVLFGLVHLQWNIAIDTFIFSFALIYVFEKTGNLWAAITLHALKNGIAFVGLFLLT